ncbi:nucleoporin NUP35-like isoform X2 [Ptychodera flava]
MTMGSPGTPSSNPQQYLPGYLMGDPSMSSPASPASVRLWSHSSGSSPPQSRTSNVLTPSSSLASRDSRPDWSQQRSHVGVSGIASAGKDKTGAPPVAPLFDPSIEAKQADLSTTVFAGNLGTRTPLARFNLSRQGLTSPGSSFSSVYSHADVAGSKSPAQIDPFYTQGEELDEDQLDDTWVTVFGFPPPAASFILQQFSQYGNILKHVIATSGNWMHIKYASRIQAKKALSKNSKVFGNSIMVGVTPCIDKSVMYGTDESTTQNISTSTLSEAIDAHRSPAIRPLTAAYQAASSQNEVAPSTNTPKKNTNVVSRTLEYMLGW